MAKLLNKANSFLPDSIANCFLIQCAYQIIVKLLTKVEVFVAPKIAHLLMPHVFLTWVSVKSMSRETVELQCDVQVINPHSHSLPISAITYKFKSANREIGSGEISNPGSVRAKDKTTMTVTIKVPYDSLLSIVKDIAADWEIDYEMDVGLIVELPIVGNCTIPLSQKGTLTLLTRPKGVPKLPTLPSLSGLGALKLPTRSGLL